MRWRFFNPTADRRLTTGDAKNGGQQSVVSGQIVLRCPLCGIQFRVEDAARCATCALAKRCGLVMCPNCSYEFAP